MGRMLNSSDAEERAVAEQLRVFFPNQNSRGAHTDISGAGMTASARNVEAALSLLEPLTGELRNARRRIPTTSTRSTATCSRLPC